VDPFLALWWMQQVPVPLWVSALLVGAWRASGAARWALLAVGVSLLGGLAVEAAPVLQGGLPRFMGPYDPWWRWLGLALVVAVGRVGAPRFTLPTVVGAVVLGFATSIAPAVVTLGAGRLEPGTQRRWLVGAIACLALRALLAGPWWGDVAATLGGWLQLSIDGATVAASLLVGAVELAAWVAVALWAVQRPAAA
jgi:hypothetical protein